MLRKMSVIVSELASIFKLQPRYSKMRDIEQSIDAVFFILPLTVIPFASLQNEGKWFECKHCNWSYRLDTKDANLPLQRIIRFIRTEQSTHQHQFNSWAYQQLTPISKASELEISRLLHIRDVTTSIFHENTAIHFSVENLSNLKIDRFFITHDKKLVIFKLISVSC